MPSSQQRIAILGASGYTGAELIRLLSQHPYAHIVALTADSQAGKPMAEIYPHLAWQTLPPTVTVEEVDYSQVDIVFCGLPHGTTQEIIAALPVHLRVIDLSADFRLRDTAQYTTWYGHAHRAPDLQKEAVYGLTEWARAEVKNARLVANPGCYPTSALLPLLPLLKAGAIASDGIIIDAKSGVTGAGRSVKQSLLYAELSEGASAYGIGHHRHTPEMEQAMTAVAGSPVSIHFTPHLLPMNRGMLSTIYVRCKDGLTADDLWSLLHRHYAQEHFVHILPAGQAPSTHMVRGSNYCAIGVFDDHVPGYAILVSVIDNLVKGASGQAIQNMNAMCGYPERTGLEQGTIFP